MLTVITWMFFLAYLFRVLQVRRSGARRCERSFGVVY
jgi:hypothetical protein